MGLGRVVCLAGIAARSLLGLGFFVEVVAQGDAHFAREWRWKVYVWIWSLEDIVVVTRLDEAVQQALCLAW